MIIENKPNRYFHVTLFSNLDSIKENGIIPSIGYFSKIVSEQLERVYLFNSFEEMNDALGSWFGEAYESYCDDNSIDFDSLELLICVIDIPLNNSDMICRIDNLYESYSYNIINPEYITFYSERYEEITN